MLDVDNTSPLCLVFELHVLRLNFVMWTKASDENMYTCI